MAKKFSKVEEQYENEEKYVQPLSKNNLDDEMFDALDAALVDEATLPINKIIPDPTQPRRIIPYQFLDYLEDGYGAVIGAWEEYVFDATDDFPTVAMLEGKKSVGDYVNDDPIVMAFGAMVAFAANIHDIGLNHPIGVATRGDVYRIIYGERRWTAFQFLNHYLEGYEKIPARVANLSEWELAKMQASENSHRPELNAIAKARMFAKLLISARTEGGERYDSWKQLVAPGGCDRPYWAQVANGEIHRIPRGMGEQFVYAMNISVGQMRNYRNLLKLFSDHNLAHQVNNALWLLGDEGDWSENFLREIGQYLSADDVDTILNGTNGYTVTTVTVSRTEEALREAVESAKEAAELAKKQADKHPSPKHQGGEQEPVDKSQWESFQWVGKEAWAGSQKVFVIDATRPQSAFVQYEKDGKVLEGEIHISALFEFAPGETPTLSSLNSERDSDNADTPKGDAPMDKYGLPLMAGQTVRTRTGHEATVVGEQGRMIALESEQHKYLPRLHYPETLEIVKPDANTPHPPTPSPTRGDGEQDVSWQGKVVSTVVGAVAKVVEDNGDRVKIQFPAGHFANQDKKHLTLLPESEWVAAVNRHLAQSGQEEGLQKSVYPNDLKGRRVGYDGEAAIIVAMAGEGKVYIQCGKERLEVEIDELDFNFPMPVETKPDEGADTPQLKGLVFAEDDAIRMYLKPYRALAVALEDENARAAIEWLSGLTYERTNREQLDAAMSHVMTHIESINARVEMTVFEVFRLKLAELN